MNKCLTNGLLAVIACLPLCHAAAINELTQLTADDGEALDGFGESLEISGDLLIVGASFADIDGAETQGAAYVFETDGAGSWTQVAKLTSDDGVEFDQFGIAVAIDGDTAVVGAKGAPIGGNSSQGAAYVFRHAPGDTSSWTSVRKLFADSSAGNLAEYGTAVDIDGDTIIVGAQKGGSGSTGGFAYLYDKNTGGTDNWGEIKRLVDDVFDSNASFGVAVAIDGDTAVVGANALDQTQFTNEGAFYIYNRNEGGAQNFGQTNRIYASVPRGNAKFGEDIAIDGNTIAVGTWNFGGTVGSGSGRAYMYENPTGTPGDWIEIANVEADDAMVTAFFGISLALVGDTLVSGASNHDSLRGQGYVFSRNETGTDSWGQIESLTASDSAPNDALGGDVAASAQHIAVGAAGNGAGVVYLYPGPGGNEPDSDGDGVTDDIDNCTLVDNAAQIDSNADGFGNACDADLNDDCVVNVVDLGLLRTVFFSDDADADLNGDGVVNVIDLGTLRSVFFAPPGPSGVTFCP
ncbi:MAG: hypothetical protein AB8G17_00630 [Gammaproteobacteria bacterium]